SAAATASIVLDTVPATMTLTMPIVDNQSIAVNYTLSENVASATISFAIGGMVVGTQLTDLTRGSHTVELSGTEIGLTDGNYMVSITAVDFAGNVAMVSNANWRYDTTIPIITLSKPATNGVDNQSIAINCTASEALSSMMLVFSSGGMQVHTIVCGVGTTTVTGSGLTHNATYTVQIVGTDTAGNRGSSTIVSNWRYDNEVDTPTLRLYDQISGSETVTISAIVRTLIDAATDTVGWWLSEQSAAPDENPLLWVTTKSAVFQLSNGNGTKTVYLWVKDIAGNVSQSGTAGIMLDTTQDNTLPTVNLITPATNGADNVSIKVSYYLSEPCQGGTLTFGTAVTVTGSLTGQYGTNTITLDGSNLGLINGQTYTVSLSMADMNGNRATSTNTNWTYDIEMAIPSFYLMNKITGSRMYTHTPRVDVSVKEHSEAIGWLMSETLGIPTEEAAVNAKPFEFTLSPGDGTKTVYLWARDMAGNVSLPATANIILNSNMDVIPPVVNLISPASNGVDNESIQVIYTISEDITTLSLTFTRTGGVGTVNGSHSYSLGTTSLTAGQHETVLAGNGLGLQHGAVYTVSLKATDAFRNSGQGVSTNWRYDISIATPTLTLNNGAGYTRTRQVSVSVNNDSEAIGWLIGTATGKPTDDDSRWLAEEPTTFDLGTADGTVSVYLWTKDAVGNISATATASIVLDTVPATMTLTMPIVDNQSIAVAYQFSKLMATASITFSSLADANSPHRVLVSPASGSITLNGVDLNSDGERTLYDYLKNAIYTVTLEACDLAGNISSTSTLEWKYDAICIDTESPLIILSQPATGGFGTQGVRVSYSLSENIASGTLRLSFIRTGGSHDGYSPHRIVLGSSSKGEYSFIIDGKANQLVDGAIYTVTLEGEDVAGNKAQIAANTNWTYDLSAPIITLCKPSNNGRDNHELELMFVLSEDVKPESMVLRFGGMAATATLPYAKGTNTANINIAGLGLVHGNTYTITMQAVDMADNPSAIITKTNWTYDDNIGTPSLSMATTTISRLITVMIINDNETVAWLLGEEKNAQPNGDDPGWRSTRPTAFYISSAGVGEKQVYLWVKDAAGNVNSATTSITLTGSSTTAQLGVSIQSPQSGDVGSQTIRLQYTLTEPVDPESLRLVFIHTAGANDPNSPHTVTSGLEPSAGVHNIWIKGYSLNLVDGAVYTLRLEAMAGTLATAQISNLRYDISSPIISLISPATNGYGNGTITVRYQASEPLAGDSLQLVFYRGQEAHTVTTLLLSSQGSLYIKGNDLSNDGSLTTNDTLTNGATYTVCLTASDLAGNRAAPIFSTNWKYDTSIGIPTLSLKGGATYTNSSIVSVETTENEDIAKWLISETQKVAPTMDNSLWTNKPTAYSFSIGEGKKTVYLWVQDGAGNINITPAVSSIIMDTQLPKITLNLPASNGAGNGTIAVSYYLSEDVAVDSLKLTFKPTGRGYGTECVITAWLTSYRGENMVELNGLGLKNGTIYAVSLDATDFAGNIGVTAVNHNWKYDTTIGTPTMLIRDYLTNGTQCTGARLVRLEISGDEEAVKWLISEDMHASSNKDLPWQQDKPAYFTLGTTSGVRTVFLWIQDNAGNISSVAQDSINLDIETPQPPGTPTTNGQFFPKGTYTLSWDASLAAAGIELYEVQEYLGSQTPDADNWNTAATYRATVTLMSLKAKKHGDSLWYRVRARNNVGVWSSYSGVSEEIIIAELFGTNTAVTGSSIDGRALVNIPQGILTDETYIIIERDPLNYGKNINPKTIKAANDKDDVDLSFDRIEDTIAEFNAYIYNNGTSTRITTFTNKVRISLRYRDVNQDGFVDNVPYRLDERTLKVYRLNETTQQWVAEENSIVDPVANTVSAEVDHFSIFVLRGTPLRPATVLGNVRVYPNPYKPNSNPMHNSGVHFGGTAAPFEERLTEQVTIKIFTVTGELVRVIDGQTSGEYIWDAKNDDGDEVSTGVYIYQITNEQAGNSFGKVAIVK
ncbi:hypothetical protein COX18_02405, partial [Candidatus Desantisbacteria bacterium CG23_combo_of_CG06-09_8_20_14_all_40_23]